MDLEQTIVALSSGVGPARRAIVRLSGPQTAEILDKLLDTRVDRAAKRAVAFPCFATLELLPEHPQTLPVFCYWWPTDRCFTGEPSAELHLVGSLPIAESLVEACVRLGGTLAERGAFTLRSFLAGKIDLTQAEAVLAVISAEEPEDLELALSQLAGNLTRPVRELRNELLQLAAHLEAGLDFVEEDIEFISAAALLRSLDSIRIRLDTILEQLITRGGRSREPTVVLVGLPNAGKSTLFNALLDTDRALVSKLAGTTRDAISCRAVWNSNPIELIDTAGIEELSEMTPRAIAQGILQERIRDADLLVFCIDMHAPPQADWIAQQTATLESGAPVLKVGTKADLLDGAPSYPVDLAVDIRNSDSVAHLRRTIADTVAASQRDLKTDMLHHTMLRCRESLERAQVALQQAMQGTKEEIGEELVAADLQEVIHELSFVIGEVHTEDVLGEIFSRFCIGK